MNTTTDQPVGRRTRNREFRAEFDRRRCFGLAARLRVKLARICARCDGQCNVCVRECAKLAGRTRTL